ncbi:MAG: pyridoxamine 5'-phosphate oxidase family protein [Mycobacterium sp.]
MAEREHAQLSWSEVTGRLARARSYWLGTTNPDGSPHATPVWGVVVGDGFYVYSELSTVKARNLARDGRGVVHLESSEQVTIVHGHFDDIGRPADTPEVVEALETMSPKLLK